MAAKRRKATAKSEQKPAGPAASSRRLVTQSEYARHRDVSPERVGQWRKTGRLVTTGKGRALRVDVDASDRLVEATHDPQQDVAQELDPDSPATLRRAEFAAQKEEQLARLARLKADELEGQLVDRAAQVFAAADLATALKTALLELPASVAPTMAAQLGCDAHELHEALDAAFRVLLERQSQMADQMARRMRGETVGDAVE